MALKDKVRATLMNWLGVPLNARDTAAWGEIFGGQTVTGKHVTVDSAMQIATVWACVRLLSETVSTLPLRVYRRRADGKGRDVASDHPLFRVLCQAPNAEMTPGRLMLMIVASLVLRGNAFVEIVRIAGRVTALLPLIPQSVSVRRESTGLVYDVADGKGGKRVLQADSVMHIRGFGLDGVMGLMPIHTGRETIGASIAANEATSKMFDQGMQASGVLTVEGGGVLSKEQRERIRENLTTFSESKRSGKIMVLEGNMKYQGISMNPESAQMLQTRAFNVEEVCRWFGIPPFMVGHMDKASSWASSVEGQNLQFLTSSLRPILDNIESEIIRCLIAPREWASIYAEFSVEGLLRADSAGRASFYTTALQNGWMSRNEVRALENLPPIPGGEIYTAQSNLLPLEKLGQTPAAPALPAPAKRDPAPADEPAKDKATEASAEWPYGPGRPLADLARSLIHH